MSTQATPPQQPGENPQYAYPVPPPQKKRGKGCIIAAVALLALLLVGLASCMAMGGAVVNEVDKQNKTEHVVKYEVSGDGKALITYSSDGSGSQGQENDAALPWTKEVKTKGTFNIMSLSAMNGMDSKGEIKCKISVDGKVVKESSAKGAGASATCTATQ